LTKTNPALFAKKEEDLFTKKKLGSRQVAKKMARILVRERGPAVAGKRESRFLGNTEAAAEVKKLGEQLKKEGC